MFEEKQLFEDEYFDIENYQKEGLELISNMLPLMFNKNKLTKEEKEKLAKYNLRICEVNLILGLWTEYQKDKLKEE